MMDLKCTYQDLDSVCIFWVISPPLHPSTKSRVLEASLQAGHVKQVLLTSGLVEALPTSIQVVYLDSCSAPKRADLIPSFWSSSTRSPLWCICRRMSQPPTNSPLKNTCGIVGQLVNVFTPIERAHDKYITSAECYIPKMVYNASSTVSGYTREGNVKAMIFGYTVA